MGNGAKTTRENRTITVDFQDESAYVQLLDNGKAFVEFVLAFILALGFQLAHKAACRGGGSLTPSHSKYHPIERCWGILELHWNGAKLVDVETMLAWAKSMTWKGIHPIVELSEKGYQKGGPWERRRCGRWKPVWSATRSCPHGIF